ncbi:MAG: ATP synthase subunit I [Spirochaetota bacterium]
MHDLWAAALAFAAGMGLGAFFFYGLHLTVSRIPRARVPGLLAAASFFLRVGAAAAVFYLFARQGRLAPVIACLGGFLLTRFLLVKLLAGRPLAGGTARGAYRGEGS